MWLLDRLVERSVNRSRQRSRRLFVTVAASTVALVGSVTAAVVALAEDDPVVLLQNGFEDGSVTPWTPRGGGVQLNVVDGGHSGAKSLAISNPVGLPCLSR